MMLRSVSMSSLLILALGFAACGGSKPTAEAPKTEAAPKAEPPKAEPEKPAEPPKESAPAERARKPAKDFLLATGWEFMLSFKDSDLKAKAEERCAKKAKDDEAATRECVAQAAAEAAHDRLELAKDDKGGQWLVYFGKVKGKDVVYTKLPIKVAKEETDKLVLTPNGKDQGRQAMQKVPAEIVLEMPDEYAVVWQHPERGKLVFAVKVAAEGPGAGGEKKNP